MHCNGSLKTNYSSKPISRSDQILIVISLNKFFSTKPAIQLMLYFSTVSCLVQIKCFLSNVKWKGTEAGHCPVDSRWRPLFSTSRRTRSTSLLQSGASSLAKHGGAYGSIEDPVPAPGHCEPQVG